MKDPNGMRLHLGPIERKVADDRNIYITVVIVTQTSFHASLVTIEWAGESFDVHSKHPPMLPSQIAEMDADVNKDLYIELTRLTRADHASATKRRCESDSPL